MIQKLKTCSGCGEQKPIWKSECREKFCKSCWGKKTPVKFSQKQSKPIKPKSDKKQVNDALYSVLRMQYMKEHPFCQAHLDGCQSMATDVHHKRGRGEYLLDISTWIPVCRSCHQWIEEHPKEAKLLNLSQNRL